MRKSYYVYTYLVYSKYSFGKHFRGFEDTYVNLNTGKNNIMHSITAGVLALQNNHQNGSNLSYRLVDVYTCAAGLPPIKAVVYVRK